ncbi:MAG: hypothetical protein M3237_18530 [Actinomycetota bacterium]|nr:hypothetical protein [Actinomycetota bacterium]
MDTTRRMQTYGGALLAVTGVPFLMAGLLHPHGDGSSFEAGTASMLQGATWSMAHWFGLVAMVLLVWAVWLLVDSGWTRRSAMAHAGARLTILAGLFMAVQMAAEVGAGESVHDYAAGRPAPLVDLLEAMQVVGWPALGLGFALLALGATHAAPRPVSLLAAVGGIAAGLGGILVMGLHILAAAPLFAGTSALVPWIVWSGVRAARRERGSLDDAPDVVLPGRARLEVRDRRR